MTIAEILKAKGIDNAIINEIQEEMKANKIFTASEENLDIRYGKLKTEHDGKLAELSEAQNLIAELEKSSKGNKDLQGKITAYETQVAQLQDELTQTKLDNAIKVELLSSKALDVDYLTFKLKEKGETLTLDENDNIKGWDAYRDGLKTQFPTMFESASGNNMRVLGDNRLPSGDNSTGGITQEQFAKMGYQSRLKLKQEQPDVYAHMTGKTNN